MCLQTKVSDESVLLCVVENIFLLLRISVVCLLFSSLLQFLTLLLLLSLLWPISISFIITAIFLFVILQPCHHHLRACSILFSASRFCYRLQVFGWSSSKGVFFIAEERLRVQEEQSRGFIVYLSIFFDRHHVFYRGLSFFRWFPSYFPLTNIFLAPLLSILKTYFASTGLCAFENNRLLIYACSTPCVVSQRFVLKYKNLFLQFWT